MGFGDARDQRRWQRELEAQIRALPTYEDETPDGGPVDPLPRDLPRPPGRRARRGRRGPAPRPTYGAFDARSYDALGAGPGGARGLAPERRRTVVTVTVTMAVIAALLVVSAGPGTGALRQLLGWGGDRGDTTSYAFLAVDRSGNPITWSSCDPIHYLVNPAGAPPGWEESLDRATAAITEASGLELVDDGLTDDRDFDDRFGATGPEPVLIGWATPDEVPRLGGDTVGLGGPSSSRVEGFGADRQVYVTGSVVLDGPAFERMEREGERSLERAVLTHELGHLVGLDHVDDPKQLMYPSTTYQTTFGTGDLQGLQRLGAGPCT